MKKILLSILILCSSVIATAQYDTTAPYLKTKLLPKFNLVSLDSVAFDQTILAGNKNTIIMLFNPECGHCQEQMKLLLEIPEVAASAILILASTESIGKLKTFADKFQLGNYWWIHIGKDTKYFFGGFYQPKTIPVLAFYNKKQQLVYFNQGNVKKKAIIDALQQ
jgi:thiol-disulfide isomerase/thioredoxin